MTVKYRIQLSREEQQSLKDIIQRKKIARHKRTHAQILLALDENGSALTEAKTANICAVSPKTVQRVRKRCVEEGLDIAVDSKFSHQGRRRTLNGEQHAHLVALVCSKPPEGICQWNMQLLADRMIELEVVETISDTTVWRELKKTN